MRQAIRERLDESLLDWRRAYAQAPFLVGSLTLAFIVVSLLAVAASTWLVVVSQDGLPNQEAISRIGDMNQATAVYDAHDQLAFTIFQEQRIDVSLSEISPNLVRALLAIEDQRFYDHGGFDAIRIGSAAVANIRHRRVAQGGSTITQQLARQNFLTTEKTLRRKLQELVLAARIERTYTKAQILEFYLNKVYFGDGLYGAEAASRGYFNKHARDLTIAEAALLAGLVKSPSSYAPTNNMDRAVTRRNVVLQSMLDAGAIDRPTFTSARESKVELNDGLRAQEPYGQYFKEEVRREIVDRFGWQRVYKGGLRVFTTIDMPMQLAAEQAVAEKLKSLDARRRALLARRAARNPKARAPEVDKAPLQAALVALDPVTGHVRAMVGGRDFNQSRFNRATQAHRQPGSAFKPFVYAAALEAGFSPATVIDRLDEPVATVQGAWTPDDHSSASSMTMRTALKTSSNRAAVRMLQRVGIPTTVRYAKSLGIGDLPSVPSLALGSGEVTVTAITAAYAAFANHGHVPQPLLVRRVEDQDGAVLFRALDASTRAVSDTTAFLMSTMLADVINAGTGAGARGLGFSLPAAGKTGTTNEFHDAWFVGFTPKLATGVWIGFDQPRTILPNGFAADIAVPVWAAFMKAATRGDKSEWLKPPLGVTTAVVCRLSGELATDGCRDVEVEARDGHIERRSMVYTEYFARGTDPTSYCDWHPTHGIFERVAAVLGAGEKPEPPRVEETGLPSTVAISGIAMPGPTSGTPTVVATDEAVQIPPAAPSQQKRGFWSRVFRRDKDGVKNIGKAPDAQK